jgi:hypothetical protein
MGFWERMGRELLGTGIERAACCGDVSLTLSRGDMSVLQPLVCGICCLCACESGAMQGIEPNAAAPSLFFLGLFICNSVARGALCAVVRCTLCRDASVLRWLQLGMQPLHGAVHSKPWVQQMHPVALHVPGSLSCVAQVP